MTLAIVAGAAVWFVLLIGTVVWLGVLVFRRDVPGPRAIGRWLLGSWLSRLTILACWGVAGWHIFCQRP